MVCVQLRIFSLVRVVRAAEPKPPLIGAMFDRRNWRLDIKIERDAQDRRALPKHRRLANAPLTARQRATNLSQPALDTRICWEPLLDRAHR